MFFYDHSKGQIILKQLLVSSDSSKREGRDSFLLLNNTKNELVCCFLEESEDTKSCFKIIWPLADGIEKEIVREISRESNWNFCCSILTPYKCLRNKSHFIQVTQWAIFMKQNLRFELVFGFRTKKLHRITRVKIFCTDCPCRRPALSPLQLSA